jgi:hypothetical protein
MPALMMCSCMAFRTHSRAVRDRKKEKGENMTEEEKKKAEENGKDTRKQDKIEGRR